MTAAKQVIVCVVVCAPSLAACGGSEERPKDVKAPQALKVDIEEFKFVPSQATVKAGGTITFVNRDKAPHTAETADFDTGRLDKGQAKRIKFDKPGTYEYFCGFHRFMTAAVKVTD